MKFIKQLALFLPILQVNFVNNTIFLILDISYLKKSLLFIKLNEFLRFDILVDICAVDYYKNYNRFEITYIVLSILYNTRIFIKFYLNDLTTLESISDIFISATWWEREVWDMFGIFFENNRDMRRILTDYGFEGHPLRKDFPLSGFLEVKYDFYKKTVIFNPTELSQKFYSYNYISPWSI